MARILKEKFNWVIEGDLVSKFLVFDHFLRNWLTKVSNFLQCSRRQQGASFDFGALFWENLNPGLHYVHHGMLVLCFLF